MIFTLSATHGWSNSPLNCPIESDGVRPPPFPATRSSATSAPVLGVGAAEWLLDNLTW